MEAGAARVRVFLLGRFAVEYAGKPIAASAWKRRRPVELLTTLALSPGYVLHREELIDRLWPDKDLESGANNLYRTLHDLRRITGDDVVCVERGAVRLHDETWVDVSAFEKAASAGSAQHMLAAIDLYAGSLLPDDPYSEHIEPRRVGLRQRFIDVALQVARLTDEVGPDQRIAVLRRLLEVEPTLEEGHRQLMTLLAELGRVADACEQFVSCADALREQLDARPGRETIELHKKIKDGLVAPRRSEPVRDDNWSHVAQRLLGTDRPPAIRGREAVLAELEQFSSSGSGALLVIGEAGAGKTRMAVECARLCAERGAVVLAGLGYDFEGSAPYTPFVDAWTDVLRLVPGHNNPFLNFEPTPGASAQEDRLRLYRAVEQSLVELAGPGLACVLIEDLHQADESSLHLFHHLARASRRLPVALIGTLREEAISAGNPLQILLGSLERERTTRRVTLERLDKEDTRVLLADLWGDPGDDAVVERVYGLAGGNPFFTEEIASAMRDEKCDSFVPSSDLMQTVRGRMSRLGSEAERLLIAASVQGVRFEFELAGAVANLEQGAALDALDAMLAAKVVEEHDGRYRFRHALMREALYDSLSAARRVFLHRATAAALEASAGRAVEPELLAFHHHAAGNLDQALPYVLRAIENAQRRLGFGEAVTHCQRALDIMDSLGIPPGPDRYRVLRNMGGMRVALGDLDSAVEDLDRAAELVCVSPAWTPGPVERCAARRLAGLALIESGQLDGAEEHLEQALADLGDADDPAELCHVYYHYSQLRWHQSRHQEAFELAQRCLEVAERANDEVSIAKGYEMLALACHSLGEWKQGQQYEDRRKQISNGALDVASAFDVHL